MQPAIRVENLSKRYRLGATRVDNNLTENLKAGLGRVWRGLTGRAKAAAPESNEFWALKDVSFEVKPGEVVGIIGRNGAGKSTLLKVLSRIVEPTGGRATVRGRMGSLLEVGTGFHPELTGRENIYLNGSILGMSQKEITRKFDEIVAFSEIEQFLDTPVKRYSSGMYVRLAFAVAAHLEPEILVVDEVLAVGDIGFQKKCLGKMEDVGRDGRTILFVSHSMPAITRLCKRCVLLADGGVVQDGPAPEVAAYYLHHGDGAGAIRTWDDDAKQPGSEVVKLLRFAVVDATGKTTPSPDIREPIWLEVDYSVQECDHVLVPNLHFFNEEGTCVFVLHDTDPVWHRRPKPAGRYRSRVQIPGNFLAEGTLFVGVAVSSYDPFRVHVYERDAVAFRVIDSLMGGTARGDYVGHLPGVVRPLLTWSTTLESDQRPG